MKKTKPKLIIHKGETICHQMLIEYIVADYLSANIPSNHDKSGEQHYTADADYYIQILIK